MNFRPNISTKRIFLLLFIIASIYFWVLLPIIRAIVNCVFGRVIADEVWLSLMTFEPIDGLFNINPQKTPSGWLSFLLYYLEPASEFFIFSLTFFMALHFHQKIKVIARFFIYAATVCAVIILIATLRENIFVGVILPFLAALSGIAVAHIIIFARRSST